MRPLLPLIALAFLTVTSTPTLAAPRIERILVSADRAVIHGQTDAAHDLVLRFDGGAKPLESRSSSTQSGEFSIVVQATDKIPLEGNPSGNLAGGKLGYGLIVTFTHGDAARNSKAIQNIHLPDYGLGKCVFRTRASSTDARGVLTFADATTADGTTMPISLRIEPAKNLEPATK